jgi:hypothetical protein
MRRMTETRRLAVFGSIDGLTMCLGLIFGLVVSKQDNGAAWHAALGGAAGELVGMTSGQYLSDKAAGLPVAAACGLAGALACLSPGIPFALTPARLPAIIAGTAIAVVVASVISWLRPERGLAAIAHTFGILGGAGILAGLTGLI